MFFALLYVLFQAIKTRFACVFESKDALLAAVTLPKFRLSWLRDQDRKDLAKASLVAECRKHVREQPQQPGKTQTPQRPGPTKEEEFFYFEEDEEDTYATVETEVAEYLKSGVTGIDTLNQFTIIKKISLKHNAATPSSGPLERLFSLGKLILSPKRNRLSDMKFEKLLLLRYNHWFEG